MGLNNDLKLVGNQFSNASTALFVAYLIAEVPNGMQSKVLEVTELTFQPTFYKRSLLLNG